MAVTYVRNDQGIFELVGPGGSTTDTTLSLAGKPADAAAVGGALTNCATKSEVNSKLAESTLAKIFGTHYDLPTTVTPGGNYSAASGNATLVGNMLRVRFSATRKSVASGNIDNETVASFSIAHGGKITGGFSVCLGNGTTGHIANMLVANVACNETALTFNITLTATGGDTSGVNPYFAMPVLIDIDKF